MAASDGSGSPSRPSMSTTSVERRGKTNCTGREIFGIIVKLDEEWSAQLELAYADASVRLGSQILECLGVPSLGR